MSFRDTKTPTKPTAKAKWQVPMRPHPTQGVPEYYMEGELKDKFLDEHELLTTINVPAADVSEFAGIGKSIGAFKRKEKITEKIQQTENLSFLIIKDNNKTIIYDGNE